MYLYGGGQGESTQAIADKDQIEKKLHGRRMKITGDLMGVYGIAGP